MDRQASQSADGLSQSVKVPLIISLRSSEASIREDDLHVSSPLLLNDRGKESQRDAEMGKEVHFHNHPGPTSTDSVLYSQLS